MDIPKIGSVPINEAAKKTMQHEIEFLPAALEIQEKPPSPAGRAIAIAIMLFFGLAAVWAYFGEIDIVATAQGKIIPSGRVKIIQPFEIGVVRKIYVEEGQSVNAGDPLIELDATQTRADLGQLEQELIAAKLDAARYRQLAKITDPTKPQTSQLTIKLEPELTESVSDNTQQLQQHLLNSQWRENQAKRAAIDNTITSRKADLAATQDQIKKFQGTLPLITRRTNALKQLVDKQLGPEQNWLELEEQRVAQQHELNSLHNKAKQIRASIGEARQQHEALAAEFRSGILTQLAETQRKIEQLKQQRIKATQRTRLQTLTSPVTGVIQQLAIHTLGGVVTPAQELMKIVPQGQSLEVEAWILNKDIGFVDSGQSTEIKIETFPFTKYGTIDAEIIDVSDDAVADEERGLVYAGRVRMAKSTIQVGNKTVNLTPGMAVTAEVKTGKRRLIEYVLSPLLRYKDESLGER